MRIIQIVEMMNIITNDFLLEGKRREVITIPNSSVNPVIFRICPMFEETIDRQPVVRQRIVNRLKDFMDYKTQDHRAKFGTNDTPLASGGHYVGFSHANITQDFRIFYTKESQNPVIIKLYAVLTHVEAGIATPPNIKRQIQMSARMKSQTNWTNLTPADL